jgi:AcrR family transcriptional regulator
MVKERGGVNMGVNSEECSGAPPSGPIPKRDAGLIPDYVLEVLEEEAQAAIGASEAAARTRSILDAEIAAQADDVGAEQGRPAKSYHHGDLRAAVIAAGMKWLGSAQAAEQGDVGLRALAREVGVSATALYRHFPDKESLLDALAEEGIKRLGAVQAQAWLKAGGGRKGFRAIGIAYVRFAHEHSAVFRLSFTRQMPGRQTGAEPDGSDMAYNLLRAGVGDALPWTDNPDRAALHAWALVHGLAMLVLDQRVRWDEKMVDDVIGLTFGGID